MRRGTTQAKQQIHWLYTSAPCCRTPFNAKYIKSVRDFAESEVTIAIGRCVVKGIGFWRAQRQARLADRQVDWVSDIPKMAVAVSGLRVN